MAARSAKLSVCGPVATELRVATDRRASSNISGAKACTQGITVFIRSRYQILQGAETRAPVMTAPCTD
jgi:hypothetical protein